ncbi:Fe-S cluster assembly protein SufB, partial [Gleimia europaea]|nr:Fe-S cluster assembly protein SufB [Gleimia europaea]
MTTTTKVERGEDKPRTDDEIIDSIGAYQYGWRDTDVYGADVERGLTEALVRHISSIKEEPEWMLERRLKGFKAWERKPVPKWGPNLDDIDFDSFKYYVRPSDRPVSSWDDLPAEIKETYERLGIPDAERKRLIAGVAAQYESEVVYQQIQEDLEKQGVIFLDTDTGLKEHPEQFERFFGKAVPA